ncbi:hypothetical protein [Streptodolium elevatio]|uniref:Apea-like HEPN domain-containing protein n=1 Tax=Streptodolium elevatio TaxID=3157996 RepID=A0ABV3D8R6_9ACTN
MKLVNFGLAVPNPPTGDASARYGAPVSISDFEQVLHAWLDDIRQNAPSQWSPDSDLFANVLRQIAAAAPRTARPDLYIDGDSLPSSRVVLSVLGLDRAANAAATGMPVPVPALASDLAQACAAPTPVPETWLLLDADLPRGTDLAIGPYNLRVLDKDQIAAVHPLPSLLALSDRTVMDPTELQRSAFLQLPRPGAKLDRGSLRVSLDTRPALTHAKVLAALMLWRSEPLHVDAIFSVERGRHVRAHLFQRDYPTEPIPDHEGNELGEAHVRGRYTVGPAELFNFERFTDCVWHMIDRVDPDAGHTQQSLKGRARRFREAVEHLILASARTYGTDYVDPQEANELLLHYVIALEAILKGGAKLPTMGIKQNAAMLWLDDDRRSAAFETFGGSYKLRSGYAHGDAAEDLDDDAVDRARCLLIDTLLRWLVTSDALGKDIAHRLQDALINDGVRHSLVERPLRGFFAATPPAAPPGDA